MPDDVTLDLQATDAVPVTSRAIVSPDTNSSAALMQVISTAASNPNVDPEKLDRLLGMYERITASRAKATFDAALAEMQPKLPSVDKRGKITIRDKNNEEKIKQSTPYALFEDINEVVKPILGEHGFAVTFRTGSSPDGKVRVTAILSHREGHREETFMDLMPDATGSKNSVQAIGSSISYGKRYTMCAILNITTKGEDDDGKGAGAISETQVNELAELLKETKANMKKFLDYFRVAALYEIPANKFNEAKRILEERKSKGDAK